MRHLFFKTRFSRSLTGLALAASIAAGVSHASAQSLTPGDIVVSMYGNVGDAATDNDYLDGVPTPISLEEFTTTIAAGSTPVLTYTLPTTDNGANVGIVGEFGSSSEGTLQLTGNDEYLTLGGYSADQAFAGTYTAEDGGTALAQSTDTAVPRVAAVIDSNLDVNTTTVLNDVYSTNNIRSVYSPDGTSLYISGQAVGSGDEGGIYKTTVGTNTTTGGAAPTPIYNVVSTRTVTAYNGNLYYTADQNSGKKGSSTGIFEYTGLPTSSGQATTMITPASGTVNGQSVNFSPQGLYFANSTTLYVADTGDPKAGGTGDGGIQKWTLVGSQWVLDYTLTDPNFVSPADATSAAHGETGFEALTGEIIGTGSSAVVDLWAVSYTAGDADPNGLYAITDTLDDTTETGEAFTEVAASGADDNFKGVSFTPDVQAAPEPSEFALLGVGLLALGFWRRRSRPQLG